MYVPKESVLQCVAVCCNVLQCIAVCCSVQHRKHTHAKQECVAVCCSVLQCVAACCSVLQRVAVCCSVQRKNIYTQKGIHGIVTRYICKKRHKYVKRDRHM